MSKMDSVSLIPDDWTLARMSASSLKKLYASRLSNPTAFHNPNWQRVATELRKRNTKKKMEQYLKTNGAKS